MSELSCFPFSFLCQLPPFCFLPLNVIIVSSSFVLFHLSFSRNIFFSFSISFTAFGFRFLSHFSFARFLPLSSTFIYFPSITAASFPSSSSLYLSRPHPCPSLPFQSPFLLPFTFLSFHLHNSLLLAIRLPFIYPILIPCPDLPI